jgi:hypothetical protein
MAITGNAVNRYCLENVDSGRILLMFKFSCRIHRLFAECCEPDGMDLANNCLPCHGRTLCRKMLIVAFNYPCFLKDCCPAIYCATTSNPCPTEPWKLPGAQRPVLHHFTRCGCFSRSSRLELDFTFSAILLGLSSGGYCTNMWTWSWATAICRTSTSIFLQVFLIMLSQSSATSPTRTFPRNFVVKTRWSVNRLDVCRFPICFAFMDCARLPGYLNGGWGSAKVLFPVIDIVFQMAITGNTMNLFVSRLLIHGEFSKCLDLDVEFTDWMQNAAS